MYFSFLMRQLLFHSMEKETLTLSVRKNTYRNTVRKKCRIAVMEEFADNVKILINTPGCKVLKPFAQMKSASIIMDDEVFLLLLNLRIW